jgi:aquaporin Z
VNYVVTTPGPSGETTAFVAEFLISLLMMITVLSFANTPGLARFTPFAAGLLVSAYIAFEAPYSGMSMNPARTLGSAAGAGDYRSLWIYFLAPPAAMLLAGRLFLRLHGAHRVLCAKLHHHNHQPCIFHCHFQDLTKL